MSCVQHYTKCTRCGKLRLGRHQVCQWCKAVLTKHHQRTMVHEHLNQDTVWVSEDKRTEHPVLTTVFFGMLVIVPFLI